MKGLVVLATAACVSGSMACGSSPPSTFYALSPESGAAHAGQARTLKLRRPGLAGYLDRPEIVRRVADHRLGVVDTDRWAAPLDEMLGRVLAQDVEQRLPGSVVFTEDGAITADADLTIEVDVRRFETDADGEVHLVAEIALEKGDNHAPLGTRAVHLREAPRTATTPALLATMSDLLGRLADEISVLARADSSASSPIGENTPSAIPISR
jgi:uncharacterized lipoprotein YmbA